MSSASLIISECGYCLIWRIFNLLQLCFNLPSWRHCPSQWTLEYTGYLMTEGYYHGKATYECVDKDAESVPGNQAIRVFLSC